MDDEAEIQRLAEILVNRVQARYRWADATSGEERYALDDDDAIVRANDLPLDYDKSDLYDEAVALACCLLEASRRKA